MEKKRLNVIVHGRVQGIFFRAWTNNQAARLGLTGFVRNLPSGRDIEVEAEGDLAQLQKLLELLKAGPPGAQVDRMAETWSAYRGAYQDFEIRY